MHVAEKKSAVVGFMDFWSLPQTTLTVTNSAGDLSLPDVTVDLPDKAAIVSAYAMFFFKVLADTSGSANKLSGTQEIQVRDDTPGTWTDCINFVDDLASVGASTRENGTTLIGAIDISSVVDGDDTYNFQWDEAVADQSNLVFEWVQVGIRVYYYRK